jgi:adenylate kinase
MRLILIGPPGSGKGTQAQLLAERLGLCHFGMGDILREAVRQGTPAGREAAPYVGKGELVPDALVNRMVAERFTLNHDCPTNFVMDGYPRTQPQAVAFEQVLGDLSLDLDAVVQLVVDDDEIVRRLSSRWICPNCHASYHTLSRPPRAAGICDVCGTALTQREDDREEIVRERLRVYHQTYGDLLRYYQERGLLRQVPGVGKVEDTYQRIVRVAIPNGKAK